MFGSLGKLIEFWSFGELVGESSFGGLVGELGEVLQPCCHFIMAADISLEAAVTAIIILEAIYYLLFTPVVVYYTRRLWKLHIEQEPFIRKRHAKIVVMTVICLMLWPLFVRPCTDYIVLYHHERWNE